MGNMLFNRRLGTAEDADSELIHNDGSEKKSEYRIFKQHMYGGPKGLGDPYYRELSKMEEDPMIPQRMRDITRSQLCRDVVAAFANCSKENGFSMAWKCQEEKDCMVSCQKAWMEDPDFVAAVKEEYLNERSHYRTTGIKQTRYKRGKFINRDSEADPPLDSNGKYRPQKPISWDESYPDGPPSWANFQYNK